MSLALAQRTINRVRLIDDNQKVRRGYRLPLMDLDVDAEEVSGPIADIGSLARSFDHQHDAVICDFNLKVSNYSSINGDEIVAGLYQRRVPAVLCTKYERHLPEDIRRRRRNIPIVISPEELSSETLAAGFLICVNEFADNFLPTRRPWKTLIRVEGGEENAAAGLIKLNMIIPAWDPKIGVTFDLQVGNNPALKHVREHLPKGEIIRLYAMVNLGAEQYEDLYVDSWTLE